MTLARLARMAGAITVALTVAACGADAPEQTPPEAEETTPPTGQDEDPSTEDEPAGEPLTAGDLTAQLTCAGLPTGDRVVHTADSDPNGLLGQPDGYTSRSDLVDTRVAQVLNGIDSGAVVEGFDDDAAAEDRRDYIAGVIEQADLPNFEEWQFIVADRFLLRLDGSLTEQQAQEYADALSDLPEAGPVEPCDESGDAAPPAPGDEPQALSILTSVGPVDSLPTADGDVALVLVGAPDGGSVPFVAHNGTSEPVSRLEVSGRVVDSEGQVLATGASQSIEPNVIEPGGYAIGYVYAGLDDLPPDATLDDPAIDFTVGLGDFENIVALQPENVEVSAGGEIIGDVANPHDILVDGPLSVGAACIDTSGTLLDVLSSFADRDALDVGESSTFTLSAFSLDLGDCATLLVGASGFTPM